MGVAVVVVVIFAGAVVVAGAVVFVVVTVLDALGLDTETLDVDEPLRDDLAAPAPLLVLPLLELDVDALDEPELVEELDDPVLLELDRDAPAPAVLAVLPLDDIMHPPVCHRNHSLVALFL